MKSIILRIIVSVLLLETASCVNPFQSSTFLTTQSPNGTYTVELTGNKRAPRFPGVEHQTNFNLIKNGEYLIKSAHVDGYDWFDSDFAGMYPEHKWDSDFILRFSRDVVEAKKHSDSLSILNSTSKHLKYLKITIRDMLLVFEMPPKSKMSLQVPHQEWISWVWGDGEFSDGQRPKSNGANFYHKDELNEPLRYCLTVDEGNIKIESPIMDGYIDNGTSELPNIPKAANCDL